MDEELVVLRTFSSEEEAVLARAILEGNGIPSIVSGGRTFRVGEDFGRGTRLSVRRGDVEAALELLGEE